MTTENSHTWYAIDIAAPHEEPPKDGGTIHSRDELPAYKEIRKRHFGSGESGPEATEITFEGKGGTATYFGINDREAYEFHQDFPDRRQVLIKTHRHNEIEEIRNLPGVAVASVPASGFYYVTNTLSPAESIEDCRLSAESDHGSDEYVDKVFERLEKLWPALRKVTRDTINRYDADALLPDPNNYGGMICLRTNSQALIDAIRAIDDHIMVEEMPPFTTLDQMASMMKYQTTAMHRDTKANALYRFRLATVPLLKKFGIKSDPKTIEVLHEAKQKERRSNAHIVVRQERPKFSHSSLKNKSWRYGETVLLQVSPSLSVNLSWAPHPS